MAAEQSDRSSTYLAAVSAHRARRGAQQALRFAAFNKASFRGGGQHYKRPDCDINIFLHGELARPETLRQLLARAAGVALPEMQPARALKHDTATLAGVDVLISAHWWTSECRFPQPAVDGMLTVMRRDVITPVFKAYYGKDYMENRVAIQVGNSSSTALACVWAGDRFGPGPVPPPSFRRLFVYGTLTDPQVLRRVLQASPRYELTLAPAVLHGWHIRWWGEYPALIRAQRRTNHWVHI